MKNMPLPLNLIITIVTAVLASSGLWTLIVRRADRHDYHTKMLLGLAHDRILTLCTEYIERGYITADEYTSLNEYLYKPYIKLGGDGLAENAMKKVEQLQIKSEK